MIKFYGIYFQEAFLKERDASRRKVAKEKMAMSGQSRPYHNANGDVIEDGNFPTSIAGFAAPGDIVLEYRF